MGLLSFLKAPKTLDKATDAIVSGVDKLKLTDEERLDYQIKAAELHLKLTEKIGNESTPTAISRRIVGLMVLGPFAFLNLGSAILYGLTPTTAAHWLKLAENFENPALGVVMFYFGSHIVGALRK